MRAWWSDPANWIPACIMIAGFGGCLTVLYFGMFVWVPG